MWLGESPYVMTYGFGKASWRQVSVWDLRDLSTPVTDPIEICQIDQSNSQILPYFDDDTGLLYIGGEGDRIIRYYTVDLNQEASGAKVELLGSYTSPSIIKALSFTSKFDCDVKEVEIAKAFKLGEEEIRPIYFNVPRKRKEYFQDDIFPPTRAKEALYTAEEWWDGAKKPIPRVSLQPSGVTKLSEAPPEEMTDLEKKRVSMIKQQEEAKSKHRPSMMEHFKQFESIADTYPKTNRWDAKPASKDDVAEDEWE
jgi:coronin-7